METKMKKTEDDFVITAQKYQGCRYEGGKKEYHFCRGSTELIDKLADLMSGYGGDNYYVYEVQSQKEAEGLEIEWAGETIYMINSHAGSETKVAADFDNDEMKFADYLSGDCGDWCLSWSFADDIDEEGRIEILRAEGVLESAIQEAWENLFFI